MNRTKIIYIPTEKKSDSFNVNNIHLVLSSNNSLTELKLKINDVKNE